MLFRSFLVRGDMAGEQLVGYSDSDMAGDVDDRKSTSGVLFFLGKSPVSWQSAKQKVVALSSCEAEYIAATMAASQGVWLSRLLADLTGEEETPATLKVDTSLQFRSARTRCTTIEAST